MKDEIKIARQRTWLYSLGRVVCTPAMKLFFRTKFINKNNIPKEGRYIICSNHLSYADPVLIALGQKRKVRFMAKAELFKNKFFAALIRSLGAFPIHRGNGDMKAINIGEQILKDGGVMVIYFEGKRSKSGELLRPKSGAMLIAYQTDTPVIPACITPQKGPLKFFRKTIISFGDPVTVSQLGIKEGTPREFREASKQVMEKVAALREESKKAFEKH